MTVLLMLLALLVLAAYIAYKVRSVEPVSTYTVVEEEPEIYEAPPVVEVLKPKPTNVHAIPESKEPTKVKKPVVETKAKTSTKEVKQTKTPVQPISVKATKKK